MGRDTVNTMPMNTVDAVRDHGSVRPNAIEEGLDDAKADLEALRSYEIDLTDVTDTLLEDGIASFAKDFDALLQTIATKLERVRAGRERQRTTLSTMLVPVSERLQQMDRDRIVERIWRKDHTVWKDDPTEIANRLGWLTVVDLMHERIGELEAFAKQATADGFETAVLLGMGGSSLAPEVFARTFGFADGALELIVLDTTHPATIERVAGELELEKTLFIVASKSGGTTETLSHFAFFWDRAPNGTQFVAITDPGTPLEAMAREHGFRAVFLNPDDIGGRYSALSYFGLVPAALIGAPLHEVLDRAEEMQTASERMLPAAQIPGATLGALMGEAAKAGRDKLTLALPDEIASFGSWVEQLIAESTGKEDLGVVPVVGEPLGPPDVYGQDRVFVAIGEHDGLDALENAGHPVARLRFDGREQIGGEFFRWEMATAVAGYVLGINPFDQPNVQEAKDATKTDPGERHGRGPGVRRPRRAPEGGDRGRLRGDPRLPGPHLRDRGRDRTRPPRDPRPLQGGDDDRVRPAVPALDRAAPQGRAPTTASSSRWSTPGAPVDLPIPGQPYTFGTLIDAQALGDLRSLRARGRRVARVTFDRLMEVL